MSEVHLEKATESQDLDVGTLKPLRFSHWESDGERDFSFATCVLFCSLLLRITLALVHAFSPFECSFRSVLFCSFSGFHWNSNLLSPSIQLNCTSCNVQWLNPFSQSISPYFLFSIFLCLTYSSFSFFLFPFVITTRCTVLVVVQTNWLYSSSWRHKNTHIITRQAIKHSVQLYLSLSLKLMQTLVQVHSSDYCPHLSCVEQRNGRREENLSL